MKTQRTMMKGKIHRATVTGADLHYEGSISIDPALLARADILPYERVEIYDVNNGARFNTYAILGKPGEICLNGAAARMVQKGDLVIIACYGDFDEEAARAMVPKKVFVDARNRELEL